MFHRCALGQEVQLPDQYASGGGRAERFLAAADMRVLDESAAADPTNELSPIENIYRGSRLSKVVCKIFSLGEKHHIGVRSIGSKSEVILGTQLLTLL